MRHFKYLILNVLNVSGWERHLTRFMDVVKIGRSRAQISAVHHSVLHVGVRIEWKSETKTPGGCGEGAGLLPLIRKIGKGYSAPIRQAGFAGRGKGRWSAPMGQAKVRRRVTVRPVVRSTIRRKDKTCPPGKRTGHGGRIEGKGSGAWRLSAQITPRPG